MLPQSEIDAAEAYLAEPKHPLTLAELTAWVREGKPLRHECQFCKTFLGGDPESPAISAGICSPLCAPAIAAGWSLTPKQKAA
jgi:hypothetical protein